MWIKIGRSHLQESGIYIRLEDQALIAPIGVWKNAETSIMGITTMIDYEVIDIQDEKHTYPVLVGRTWGRKMKASISLEKGRIKIKGKGKRVIIPLDPVEGRAWEEPDDDDFNAQRLYQVIKSNEDIIEPNINGEIHLGSPLSIGYNSDSELYDWEIEKYESIARDSYSIIAILKKSIKNYCFISAVPKVFEK